MNLNLLSAQGSLEDSVANLSDEEAIEVCRGVIREADRIIDICQERIDQRDDESDEDEE